MLFPTNRKSHVGFRLPDINLIMAYSEGHLVRPSVFPSSIIGRDGRFGSGASLYRHGSYLFGRLWVRRDDDIVAILSVHIPSIFLQTVLTLCTSFLFSFRLTLVVKH